MSSQEPDRNPSDELAQAQAEVLAARAALDRAAAALEQVVQHHAEMRVNAFPLPSLPVSEHRRQHRAGVPSIIDSNPALQDFIAARIDRMTFKQIADEIARHFPPELHIHQSTVHRWFQKRR